MRFAVVSTGSKANCTYIEHDGQALLIDCGLSAKEAKRRLLELGVDLSKIIGLLVTHEHSDHIKGISVLSRQLELPVFANVRTAAFLKNIYACEAFKTGENFKLGSFDVYPFSIVHDAADPVGFTIETAAGKHTQLTDLGRITNIIRAAAKDSNSMLLEFNYDQQLLYDCDYPWQLKQRISSAHGHLSNEDAALFLSEIKDQKLKHVILGHLSENSNNPDIALASAAKFNDFSAFSSIKCGSVSCSTEMMQL